MPLKITYFAHGTTTDNEQNIATGWNQGELSELGKEQAVKLGQQVVGQHIAIVAHQAPQLALDIILRNKTWEQAIAQDWRNTKAWQPGWEYEIKN